MTGDYRRKQAGPQNQNVNEQTSIKMRPKECLSTVARIDNIVEHVPPQHLPPVPKAEDRTGHSILPDKPDCGLRVCVPHKQPTPPLRAACEIKQMAIPGPVKTGPTLCLETAEQN